MPEKTPLYEEHLARGGRMVDFAGWLLPQQYTSIREEHFAVRRSAGLFDLSHMGRVFVQGQGGFDFLQELITNDLGRIQPGHAQYSLLCNQDGGILDDLIVYWMAGEGTGAGSSGRSRFLLVVNASARLKDLDWMRSHLSAAVELEDHTQRLCLLALQGPRAQELLPTEADLESLPYFGVTEARVGGVDCLLARTGYTGEDGFEIFVPAEHAVAVWRSILGGAQPGTVLPCGLGARDVCRLEAGYRLYGSDMDEGTNPYEAGLGWTVRLQKPHFLGRQALAEVKAHGPERETAGIACDARSIPRHGARLSREGREVGEVTSGTFSFFLNRGVGMVRVKRGTVTPGEVVELEGRGQQTQGEIRELPFYRGSVKTPPTVRVQT